MLFSSRDEVIAITGQWQGERFQDGRPAVPDKYLDALQGMTLEELWKPIFTKGYENQFLSIKSLHPEFKENGELNCKLVGRAVTAAFGPTRPDYYEAMLTAAAQKGLSGTPNQWAIEALRERDVLVVDMYDKIYKGTFLGGNLTTAVQHKTRTGGAVIWGGIRDLEQMQRIPNVQVYYRGTDPTPIRNFAMIGFNSPICMGQGEHACMVLPGDIVYGCSGGVLFIPPHLVVEVVENAAKTKAKDIFGFEMITRNVFTPSEIDRNVWTVEMLDMMVEFIKTDPRGAEYRDIDWNHEYDLARNYNGEIQSAL